MRPSAKINVNLIRAFTGPRHARCEAVWQKFAREHKASINLHIFNNPDARRPHGECLQEMWEREQKRDEFRCIFTEFDFLPNEGLAHWPFTHFSLITPVEAAAYCTRDPGTLELLQHKLPGAWCVRISKALLHEPRRLDLTAGGPFNDPCGRLAESLGDQVLRLLPQLDRRPVSYGTVTRGGGTHLFFSRHYNDDPSLRPAGFSLGDILAGVDRELEIRGV